LGLYKVKNPSRAFAFQRSLCRYTKTKAFSLALQSWGVKEGEKAYLITKAGLALFTTLLLRDKTRFT
jgi:hypothetical protein